MSLDELRMFTPATVIMGYLSGILTGMTIIAMNLRPSRALVIGIFTAINFALFVVLVLRDSNEGKQ